MRTLCVTLFLILYSISSLAGLPADKQKHLGYSAAISGVSYSIYRHGAGMERETAYLSAFITTVIIGHLKEESDPIYDKDDMYFNAIGAVTGPMLFIMWEY